MTGLHDISPNFRWNRTDAKKLRKIIRLEGKPEAIRAFAACAHRLSDYAYWYALGTLWVSYTGWSDLDLWIRLFRSDRPNRDQNLMKPSELATLELLPDQLDVYRAHRANEARWISYTLLPVKAVEFAARRGVRSVAQYRVRRTDILALFLRRGEYEVLVLDQAAARIVRTIPIVAGSEMYGRTAEAQ